MIQINLLPDEYRKAESTPIARFMAIVIGAVIVTSGLVTYGFVHYGKLKGVRDVRVEVEAEFQNKSAQADVARSLQAEIAGYEARRKAIQQIARSRVMHSRKLDEFLDIVHNSGDKTSYYVWLNGIRVAPPRTSRRGKSLSGGSWA
ncbi:MAG: PilN domain-containing protein, partial [Planctomycetota bacterium]